jgi:hypothetical protein
MEGMSFLSFAAQFDRSILEEARHKADEQRQIILKQFPIETFLELPIEEYGLRDRNKTNLSYLLDKSTPDLGQMGGGTAAKLGVYFHVESQKWTSSIPGCPDALEAWAHLRQDLVKAVELAREGRWEEIDSLPAGRCIPLVLTKWLHVHFPNEVMRIYSLGHLKHYIAELGGSCEGLDKKTIKANRYLVDLLRSRKELKGWTLWEIGAMMYQCAPPKDAKNKPKVSLEEFAATFDREALKEQIAEAEENRRRIVQLFPREQLPELAMERYASSADDEETLANVLSRDETALGRIRAVGFSGKGIHRVKETGLYQSTLKNKGDAFEAWKELRAGLVQCCHLGETGEWDAIDKVEVSNWIPAVRTKLLYVYFPEEVLPIYVASQLLFYLDRLKTGFKPGKAKWAATRNRLLLDHLRAIPQLSDWSTIELALLLKAWAPFDETDEPVVDPEIEPENPMSEPAMPTPLNQILYGPPGTGKTYQVIRRAAAIAAGHRLEAGEAKARYDEFCQEGRIRLATFHQSFSYEDFMEGIRPVMDEGGTARFEVRDGVFKEIALEAMFACLERVPAEGQTGPFSLHWQSLLARIQEAGGALKIDGLLPATQYVVSVNKRGNLKVILHTGTERHVSRDRLETIFKECNGKSSITSGEAKKIDPDSHENANAAIYNYLMKLDVGGTFGDAKLDIKYEAPEYKKYAVREFLLNSESSGWQLRADGQYPPYVLIIDEINRGNISRIFGELITLIEDDKRHGADNALMVTLPVSQERFAVPPNLFLLGTMNTADKSLALLDVALRRRFEFEEMNPDFSLCGTLPEEMREVLEEINLRLELRKDRDHRIGHAFFMNVKDAAGFNQVFRRKVVPLLQEYFFNDVDGARYVLADAADDKDGFLRPLTGDSNWQRNRWRWFTDEDPEMDCWARLERALGAGTGI